MSRGRKVAYIHYLLRNDCFYDVEALVRQDPNQAAALNSAKSSPLGVLIKSATWGTVNSAILQNIPRFVEGFEVALDALVTVCPAAAGHKNKNGDTPLIIACRDGHLDSMMSENEYTSTYFDTMKWAVERMIDAYPEAVRIRDNRGQLPLHYMINGGLGPFEFVIKLVRADPDSLLQPNGWGHHVLPQMVDNLISADTRIWQRIKALVALCPGSASAQSRGGCNAIQALWIKIRNRPDYLGRQHSGRGPLPRIPHTLPDDTISEIAHKMTTTAQQDHRRNGDDDDEDYEFHAKCLDLLLVLLKAAYRHQQETTWNDNDNAAAPAAVPHDDDDDTIENANSTSSFRALEAALSLRNIPVELVRLLMAVFPNQIRQVNAHTGQLPLHIAAAGPLKSRGFDEIDRPTSVEVLLQQSDPDAVRVADHNSDLPLHLALEKHVPWNLGVQALVQADKATLCTPNADGLYPFELAAVDNHNNSFQAQRLDLVYNVLRADPQVLQLALARQQHQETG